MQWVWLYGSYSCDFASRTSSVDSIYSVESIGIGGLLLERRLLQTIEMRGRENKMGTSKALFYKLPF